MVLSFPATVLIHLPPDSATAKLFWSQGSWGSNILNKLEDDPGRFKFDIPTALLSWSLLNLFGRNKADNTFLCLLHI